MAFGFSPESRSPSPGKAIRSVAELNLSPKPNFHFPESTPRELLARGNGTWNETKEYQE